MVKIKLTTLCGCVKIIKQDKEPDSIFEIPLSGNHVANAQTRKFNLVDVVTKKLKTGKVYKQYEYYEGFQALKRFSNPKCNHKYEVSLNNVICVKCLVKPEIGSYNKLLRNLSKELTQKFIEVKEPELNFKWSLGRLGIGNENGTYTIVSTPNGENSWYTPVNTENE